MKNDPGTIVEKHLWELCQQLKIKMLVCSHRPINEELEIRIPINPKWVHPYYWYNATFQNRITQFVHRELNITTGIQIKLNLDPESSTWSNIKYVKGVLRIIIEHEYLDKTYTAYDFARTLAPNTWKRTYLEQYNLTGVLHSHG